MKKVKIFVAAIATCITISFVLLVSKFSPNITENLITFSENHPTLLGFVTLFLLFLAFLLVFFSKRNTKRLH